jgi:hypothetical protein
MRKVIQIIMLASLVFTGCSQFENNPTQPEFYTKQSQLNFAMANSANAVEVNAIMEIDGTVGGQITILQDVMDSTGRIVNVYADLIVPPGAFQGVKVISVDVDLKTASVDFNPSMQFDSCLTFNCLFSNLPLAEIGFAKGDTVQFSYIDEFGHTFPTLSKEVAMNWYQGRLRVHNAKIKHFSRYGFIRKTSNTDSFGLFIAE